MQKLNNSPEYIGQRFGRLTVIGFQHKEKPATGWNWVCKCDCEEMKVINPGDIKSGRVRSCGCLLRDTTRNRMTRYRHKKKDYPRLYGIFHGIKKRCYNKNEPRYKDYGGRGIKMCDEWLKSADGFDRFVDWALANGYTDEMSIDRVDVDGDYSPDNCRWFTLQQQSLNKRQTRWVDYKGEHIQLMTLCKRLGVSYDTVHNRIYDRGWPVEKAIETPSQQENSFSKKCKAAGLNPATVHDRIYKLGWSEEEAFGIPTLGRAESFKTYKSRKQEMRTCQNCGAEFMASSSIQAYCSAECREAAKKERRKLAASSR